MGVGGFLFVDNVGPTRRTGAQVSYSYHVNLTEELRLGLAASVGLTQFTIDGSRIKLAEADDPALYSELSSQLVVDGKFGAYLYHDKFYVGFTLPQLFQNKIDLYESENPGLNKLEDHYMLLAGYKFQLNDDFMIQPSVLVKYVQPTPVKIDATVRAHWKEMVYLGASWRNNDAIVAMIGYEWNKSLSIGYSYDFTTSNMKNYSDGTHEIGLGFKFGQQVSFLHGLFSNFLGQRRKYKVITVVNELYEQTIIYATICTYGVPMSLIHVKTGRYTKVSFT